MLFLLLRGCFDLNELGLEGLLFLAGRFRGLMLLVLAAVATPTRAVASSAGCCFD